MASWQTVAGGDVPKEATNADGEKTSYTYDTAGNTKSVAQTGAGGGNVSYTYNPASPTCQRCAAETQMSSTKTVKTSFTYDSKGNLTKAAPPKPLGETTFTYDSLGRTETLTDGHGVKKVFTYDNLDRIKTVSTTNDTVRYWYDGDGNLRQRDDSTGTIAYTFDPLQRETIRTLQDGSQTRAERRRRQLQPPEEDQGQGHEDQLHLRRRRPLLLRRREQGLHPQLVLAVLLRPGRQPHQRAEAMERGASVEHLEPSWG
ncbi:hypothetical protein [Streptomyces sp. NPDC017988]|uniref:hypothetical protein n=1 Tax=Streptomyces sp. NPDC017988 TaxID=3365025 RepID=UPI0037AF00D6